jgi:hypothetical protein
VPVIGGGGVQEDVVLTKSNAVQATTQQQKPHSKSERPPQKKDTIWTPIGLLTAALVTLYLCDTIFLPFIANWKYEPHQGLHHLSVPFTAIGLYLLMVFFLPQVMKNREPMKLQGLMVIHNYFLSYLSLVMMIGVLREVFYIWQISGIEGLMCDSNREHLGQTNVYFWYHIFYLSKMYEFVDTAILILRKKPLIFLHVYHHVITLLLCWYCMYDNLSIQWLCTTANTLVHVFMYYFYACQSLNISVWWKKYLTTLQIIQFIVDDTANLSWAYYTILEERTCSGSWSGFWFGVLVIASFLILFVQFFKKTYSDKGKQKEL